MGSARSHKWAARLRSVGIRRFELVARRLAGYAVAMEVARRAEGPEVNGDLRKTVSRRSLVPSRELKRKGYTKHCNVNKMADSGGLGPGKFITFLTEAV